ncbi:MULTISPECIES: hypothetical protein [Microbacterium]|uniref:Uncharacterized protein n=1 Tax=Microbacterium wangchenii TaxID=2541726 RepID=A0ABX5SU01_9MICO|nr:MULTISPECIES: hypothetical protein [Microbacterium]MCK6067424.1 hypothetical protein [Microbacterium sp. EYE_512]QBR89639.1 hypothetical protein E4K62_13720 [Microbacterium wangchenii]TXK16762.1 hypothetical protein FVP99_08795 [Microbacterium wangchenii]
MTEAAHPDALRRRIARRVAAAQAALLATAAFAGLLPGATILLGLLSSDPPLDVLRAVGAVLLGTAVLRESAAAMSRALLVVGAAGLAFAGCTLVDPHLGGLLTVGAAPLEGVLSAAFGAVSLATARMVMRPRVA